MFIEVEDILQILEDSKHIIFKHPDRWLRLDLTQISQETPIYCRADVIKAMEKAWTQSANGISGVEAGFRLDGSPGNYKIVPNHFTNQQHKQTLTITNLTFAIFHVHPNRSSRFPSTPKNNYDNNKKGDTGLADDFNIQIYVMHKDGLTMYDPITRQVTELRKNMAWLKPCDAF